jgi:hypothetical protein
MGLISVNVNLYHVAKAAALNADADRQNILVAIVFSVMWFESFVNYAVEELDELHSRGVAKIPRRLVSALTIFGELPERLPLATRVQVLSCLLTGNPLPPAKQPFQDFELVVKLRNGLVHMKPARVKKLDTGAWGRRDGQKLTRALRHRGLVSEPGDKLGMGWLDAMFSPDSARWAFDTAVKMATAVADMFPKGYWSRHLHEQIVDSEASRRMEKRLKPMRRP